jgi:3-oxoacyl-[acyl-carrier protein] reductase
MLSKLIAEDISKKKVFVAGASQGIGFAIARAFLKQGAIVFIGGRDKTSLKEASDSLLIETGFRPTPICGDFSKRKDIVSVASGLKNLDILIVCYGDTLKIRPDIDIVEGSFDVFERHVHNNLIGPTGLAEEFIKYMANTAGGSILFIGSICGTEYLNAPIGYAAGKMALRAVVKTLSHQHGRHKIRVNMISPGNIIFRDGLWERKRKINPKEVDEYINGAVPLRCFGEPEDIANAAIFLASSAAKFITGSELIVDGGQTHTF